ncbi:MAG: hypothetical protein IH627_20580 [Rubrivivax sp.]|nr:hypothetical protein [Rubrivivax sp.]
MGTKNATEIIGTATLAVLAITAAAFVVACGGGGDTSTGQLDGIAQATRSTAALETTLTTIAPAALSTEEASSPRHPRPAGHQAHD